MEKSYVDDVDDDDGADFKSVMIVPTTLRCKVDNCDDQDDPAFDQPWLNFTLPPGKIIIVNNYCHNNCYKSYNCCHHHQWPPSHQH